jgi:pyruvate dehydrogenase E2 component (dihydrolipoamide acetyltransferase)
LPDLGEGLEEAQLVEWLVREGDTVQLNQPLCQVETAKALVDIPSPYAGRVQTLHARPGETVAVGAPLISIARDEASAASPARAATVSGSPSAGEGQGPNLVGYGTAGPAQAFQRRRRAAPGDLTVQPTSPPPGDGSAASADGERASPLVRKVAAERGIDLSTIRGTGSGGRIRLDDLPPQLPSPSASVSSAVSSASSVSADETRISTVGIRKAIAAKMVRAWTTIPHMTEYIAFDATNILSLRDRLRASPDYAGKRLTVLPFLVAAMVKAVGDFPILNGRWDEEGSAIIVKRSINVGIATDTERGLIVPVVQNAQTLSLRQIAVECERMAQAARAGTLDARAMSGGTITLSNVGAAGPVDTGAPIINPPEVCCVGFGAIKPRPMVVDGQVVARPGVWISMACDHRVVDGATAARFLGRLVELLEQPASLV